MGNRYQFGATLVVWLAYAVIMVTIFLALLFGRADLDSFALTAPLFAFLMFLTAVTAYATRAIWRVAGPDSLAHGSERTPGELQAVGGKSKRDQAERLQALIDRLDQDEIIELEILLMSRGDDEPVTSRGRHR